MATYKVSVQTGVRDQMVEITNDVQRVVDESGLQEGVVTVFCPHTTAGIAINENADPDVKRDVLAFLGALIPQDSGFRHSEGNSDAHIKAILTGASLQVIVRGGRLALGTWQGVYLCEFDGPRSREVWVNAMGMVR
ncbi:MAG TPA: secondary thiamine-phosphate synthase enzyme YjbQ [Armatimonadota bacterium]|jgi:secondary thiamine-phosphate synthase enzyme